MDLAAVREALAASLSSIAGLQESPYLLTNPTPPAAQIVIGRINYDRAMHRGLDEWNFIVRVFVALATDRGAQAKLDTFLQPSGPTSIKAALEADLTLGGLVDDLWVSQCDGEIIFAREALTQAGRGSVSGPLLGAEWHVTVYATGG